MESHTSTQQQVVQAQSTENQQSSPGGGGAPGSNPAPVNSVKEQTPKRLHVSNIPFRFRDPDLRNMFGVSNDANNDIDLLALSIKTEGS